MAEAKEEWSKKIGLNDKFEKVKFALSDFTSTNTYARRVTKHHSYDYESESVHASKHF